MCMCMCMLPYDSYIFDPKAAWPAHTCLLSQRLNIFWPSSNSCSKIIPAAPLWFWRLCDFEVVRGCGVVSRRTPRGVRLVRLRLALIELLPSPAVAKRRRAQPRWADDANGAAAATLPAKRRRTLAQLDRLRLARWPRRPHGNGNRKRPNRSHCEHADANEEIRRRRWRGRRGRLCWQRRWRLRRRRSGWWRRRRLGRRWQGRRRRWRRR